MKEELKSVIKCLVGIVAVFIVTNLLMFCVDNYSVGVVNDASLVQVNGDVNDFMAMKSTNKVIYMARNSIWIISLIFIGLFGYKLGLNTYKVVKPKKEDKNTVKNDD